MTDVMPEQAVDLDALGENMTTPARSAELDAVVHDFLPDVPTRPPQGTTSRAGNGTHTSPRHSAVCDTGKRIASCATCPDAVPQGRSRISPFFFAR